MTVRSPYKRRPRLKIDVPDWRVGDVVTVGNTRWIVRIVNDDRTCELEASNASPGIWWRTTLSHLPEKPAARS